MKPKFTILSQKRGTTQFQHTKTMVRYPARGSTENSENPTRSNHPDHKAIAYAKKDLLQSSRLVANFVQLLRDFSPDFEDHKAKFLSRLEKSSYSMAKEILKMIHDNPDLFPSEIRRYWIGIFKIQTQ